VVLATAGVLVYSGTGNANGVDGDTILLGPPFVITDSELERIRRHRRNGDRRGNRGGPSDERRAERERLRNSPDSAALGEVEIVRRAPYPD